MSATTLLRSLARLGHVWVENPVSLMIFSGRLARSFPRTLEELGSRQAPMLIWRIIRQIWKTLLRGIVPVIVLGFAGGFGLGAAAGGAGTLVRHFLETTVFTALLRDILPLITAMVLIARSGATIAAKFAAFAAAKQLPSYTFDDHEIQRLVVPSLIANILSGAAFFLLLSCLMVGGYLHEGISGVLPDLTGFLHARESLQAALFEGSMRSALFGGIATLVAAAFGVQAAERYVSDEEETHDLHYAVWESSVTSLLICLGITIVLWRTITP